MMAGFFTPSSKHNFIANQTLISTFVSNLLPPLYLPCGDDNSEALFNPHILGKLSLVRTGFPVTNTPVSRRSLGGDKTSDIKPRKGQGTEGGGN